MGNCVLLGLGLGQPVVADRDLLDDVPRDRRHHEKARTDPAHVVLDVRRHRSRDATGGHRLLDPGLQGEIVGREAPGTRRRKLQDEALVACPIGTRPMDIDQDRLARESGGWALVADQLGPALRVPITQPGHEPGQDRLAVA